MSTTIKESRFSSVPSNQPSVAKYRTVSKKVLAVTSLTAGLTMITVCSSTHAAEESRALYSLGEIVQLTLEHNPVMAGAQGTIDQQRGHQTAAGAYPNPSITGNAGYGEIRDAGRADIQNQLTRQSITEYNMTIGQPVEWPAMRAGLLAKLRR